HREDAARPCRLAPALAVALLALALAAPAAAVTGVAFVHGKGGADLANQTVANAYWTTDMIKVATKNYVVPYTICHYDGTKVMWEAGDVVVDQIYAFITSRGINDLV